MTSNGVKSIISFIFAVVIFAVLPAVASAATLYFSPSSGEYVVGKTFSVSVYVSSADQAMNAASGVISFPSDKLEVTSLSKAGSIFTFWVQEPSFSNSAGTINFEGIVLNPGFTGSNGKVITITFRTKAAGNTPLTFSSGSVLANDGKGTNILTGMGDANFSIDTIQPVAPEIVTPAETEGTPEAPVISSLTHPDPNKWYAESNAKFNWNVPKDTTAVRLLVSKIPNAIPTITYTSPINSKDVSDLADGIWYFSVQLRNQVGWGGISHFKFQIDTTPPKPFEIEVKEGKETTNPQPTLSFETTDEMSGIDYYEIIIDKENPIRTDKSEYEIPPQDLGRHTIIVKAVDKAGNQTLAMTEINILPIEAPVITDYPRELIPGSILSIKGTALSDVTVKVYIQKDENEIKIGEAKSDEDGNWTYIGVEPVEKGTYKVWAETVDSSGAKSQPSDKVTILVSPPVFIRIGKLVIDYITMIIILLVLILVIVIRIFWIWLAIKRRKRKLEKEATEAENALHRAFKALKNEVEKQVAKLDGEPGLSEREKKICDDLKDALRISEKFIGKEIEDIEREIKK
jgi:5-hydroxyisourate hydrolase-like protein (transthyretin family)